MIGTIRWGLVVAACASGAAACSSANFDVAGDPGADAAADTQTTGDTGTTTDSGGSPEDAGIANEGGALDGGSVDGGSGCVRTDDPAEIWVDAASTVTTPSGSATCPFRHISEAVAYVASLPPKARIIRVRAGTYVEGEAVKIRPQVQLIGEGAASTKITGGGPCGTASSDPLCVVRLEGGGSIEGVAVNGGAPDASKNAIVTYGGPSAPKVTNTQVFGAAGDGQSGVLVTAGAILGPGFESFNNRFGVTIWGSNGVAFAGASNRVENNTAVGIEHQGTGQLSVGNVSVRNNANGGIRAGHLTAIGTGAPAIHQFANTSIKNNGPFGISIGANAGIKIRYCTVTGNQFGIVAVYGASNTLDFGIDGGDPGNNLFGGSTSKNVRGGLCVTPTRNTPVSAVGNKWSKCDPDIKTIGVGLGCESVDGYADIWYRGLSTPNAGNCSVGP